MRKILSFILIAVLLVGMLASCGDSGNSSYNINGDTDAVDDGVSNNNSGMGKVTDGNEGKNKETAGGNHVKYVYMGEYPQTLKEEGVTVEAAADDRGYYLGSDDCYYAKVVAEPYEAGYRFSNGTTAKADSEYYFKVEPIKWSVVSRGQAEAFLVCESVIDAKRFDDDSNDYLLSEIREYLNTEFVNASFNEEELSNIIPVAVGNNFNSDMWRDGRFIPNNVQDMVFLPSYGEAMVLDDSQQMKKVSDYAIAKGAFICVTESHYGNAIWLLRSPADDAGEFVCYCDQYGDINNRGKLLSSEFFGISPAMKIKL